ncbi:MAG: hypothetical protein KBT02_13450 [Treponema sp.]|nr:hypothetical protein [Candidatus Treponema caballi]
MQFNEFHNAKYWQDQRNEAQAQAKESAKKLQRENITNAIGIVCTFLIIPLGYCVIGLLEAM